MIPADVLNSLITLFQKPLPEVAPATALQPQFELGQKLQASVQTQLATGLFKVQVEDQLFQLQLPSAIRTGDTITLQVASLLPRLTFTLSTAANPVSTADQLSHTARTLSSLTQQPPERSFLRPINSAPLWSGSAKLPDTVGLASNLHNAISQSGLFYESHQAQWLAGSRNTAQLLLEPQNQPAEQVKAAFDRGAPTAAEKTTAPPSVTTASRTDSPLLTNTLNLPAEQIKTLQNSDDKSLVLHRTVASTPVNNTVQERAPLPGIPEHLHSLIQQQLNTLENRQVQWQGQVWPNQEMDWKIREETAHTAHADEGRQWSTQIHLDLPNLGAVTATLRFGNSGLSIALDADKSAARSKLGVASSALVSALSDRGITIASAVVSQHDNSR